MIVREIEMKNERGEERKKNGREEMRETIALCVS